ASSTNNINTVNPEVSTATTKVNTAIHEDLEQLHDDDLEEIDLKWNMALLSMRARKFYQRTGRKIIIDGSNTAGYDKSKMVLDWIGPTQPSPTQPSTGAEHHFPTPYDSHLHVVRSHGSDEGSLKLNELTNLITKLSDRIGVLEDDLRKTKKTYSHKEYQMGLLRDELEKVKQEKEGFEFKIAKFEKSAKDLDQMLESQITDKSKKGVGYHVVPSPHPLILNRPTPLDLSYLGLEEFKEPEVNEYGPRNSSLNPTIL
ncbi:hypothetical protein Tco_0066057, partial [Tanacetum coccineum]